MKKFILVSAVGDDMESIFQIVRTIPLEKVVLITAEKDTEKAEEFKKDLNRFKIPSQTVSVSKYSIDEIFKITKRIKDAEDSEIIMNVSSGNKLTSCVTLSAAFVNGIKALGVDKDNVISFPIMRFSYYKTLSDQKLRIMKHLHSNRQCCASLDELSKQVKMSLPLISYHMNGNQKVEGLEQMGLVELEGKGKKIKIKMSELGMMLMSGYL